MVINLRRHAGFSNRSFVRFEVEASLRCLRVLYAVRHWGWGEMKRTSDRLKVRARDELIRGSQAQNYGKSLQCL